MSTDPQPLASESCTEAPSVGACITSMSHVLDATEGVLDQGLRAHLVGILRFLVAVENAETAAHVQTIIASQSPGAGA